MKHLIKLAFLLLALLLPATATAYDLMVNGIYYNISGSNATVTFQSYSNYTFTSDYSGNVTIPSTVTDGGATYSVTTIGDYAFCNCSGLTSIEIPNSVTSIDNSAFFNCSGLTSITIPNSVTRIGNSVFHGCSGLTSVTIPNSVTSISAYAFYGCSGLTSIEIPNTVTTISLRAFSDCSGLTSIEIPNSVTFIGSRAFYGCSGLTSITVESGNTVYDSRNNCNAIIETASNKLIAGCKNTIIPNSVISIGREAFYLCSSLTSIEIPNSVTSIGSSAFYGCSGLTNVTIPNSVTSIDNLTFCLCSGLTNVTIPNSVTTIGNDAFYGCSSLTNIEIPNTVTTIGRGVFSGCSGLTSINVASENTVYDSRNSCNAIIETTTNKLITGCKNTIIPNSVITIGVRAFSDCSALTSIDIPNSVITIGESAFRGCSGLTSITIPNSVITIGVSAFSGCSGLTSIDIPNSVTTIGDDTFSSCSGLTNVTIPNSVTTIGYCAFYGCSSLSSINIPNSVTTIVNGAFHGCSGLSNIIIPNSVTAIGLGAFEYCSTLNEVYSYIEDLSSISMEDDVFVQNLENYGDRTLYVPKGTSADYQADTRWSQYFGSIVEIDNYLSVNDTIAFRHEVIVVPVKMFNEADVISFQTDIVLPEGLELLQEDGEFIIDPSERMTRTHSIMSNQLPDGSIRVLCYSSNYKPFTGNSGDDLFYLTVKVADNAKGDCTIQLWNTLLTNADFVDMPAPDVAATVNVKILMGDANNSGLVTVGDVVTTAQYVLLLNPQPFNFEAADVNFDGNITVGDVSRIAWMVLNPGVKAPRRAPALLNSGDRMSGEGISLMQGETRRVSIALDNALDYSAFQFDLSLPEGLTASNFNLTDRAGSHAFDVNMLGGGKFRALCYSPALTAISGHEGALLTFDVTATSAVTGAIVVDGIELVTTACESVRLDGFAIDVNSTSGVNEQVAGKTVARVDYYNLAGQQIDRPEAGVTLVVTTYTDGTRTTAKVIK